LLAGTEGATIRQRVPQSDEPDIFDRRVIVVVCGGRFSLKRCRGTHGCPIRRGRLQIQRQYF